MSREAVAELLVRLGADATAADKALDKFEKGLKKGEKQAKVTEVALGTMVANGIQGLIRLATQAVRTGLSLVDSFANSGDEIAKTASKIGVSTDQLQRLRFAADRSGASSQALSKAIKEQSIALTQAREKATPFSKALDSIGLSLDDVERMSPEQRFGAFGEALALVEDEATRTALAMDLVGREAGPELVPMMLEGRDGLKALGDEAERLGLVIERDALSAAESLNDSLGDVRKSAGSLKTSLIVALAPAISDVVSETSKWFDANREVIATGLKDTVDAIVPIIKVLASNIDEVVKGFAAWKAIGIAKEIYEIEKQLIQLAIAFHASFGPTGWITLATLAMVGFAKAIGDSRREQEKLEQAMYKHAYVEAEDPALRARQEENAATIAELEGRVAAGTAQLQDPMLAFNPSEWNRVSEQLELDTENLDSARLARSQLSRQAQLDNDRRKARLEQIDTELSQIAAESASISSEPKAPRAPKGKSNEPPPAVEAAPVATRSGPLSDTDIMLAAFGKSGSLEEGRAAFASAVSPMDRGGGGASPTDGAKLVRIDQSLTVTNNVTVEISGTQLAGLDRDAAVSVVGEAIAKKLTERDKRQMEHLRKATRY